MSLSHIKSTLSPSSSINEALNVIEATHRRLACVIENNKLVGVITDGDIRKSLLAKGSLDQSILEIYNANPIIATLDTSKDELRELFVKSTISHIPIVDDNGTFVKISSIYELLQNEKKDTTVVVMAGGLGTRMRPITENIPKPMVPVDGKPILEIILEKFTEQGFINFVICTNYKSNQIVDYFKTGSNRGASITYTIENKRLGTAGALLLGKDKLTDDLIVINGDVITNIDFRKLMDFHAREESKFTIVTHKYNFTIPFGVVDSCDGVFKGVVEKPTYENETVAGIYVINKECLDVIPEERYYDMPEFIMDVLKKDRKIMVYPINEYWTDIGTIRDLKELGG